MSWIGYPPLIVIAVLFLVKYHLFLIELNQYRTSRKVSKYLYVYTIISTKLTGPRLEIIFPARISGNSLTHLSRTTALSLNQTYLQHY